MKTATIIRAIAITLLVFVVAFFGVRIGLAFGAGSDAWLNDTALLGTIADIDARREQVLTQLSVHTGLVMIVGSIGSLIWTAWLVAKAGIIARPDRSGDGRSTWTLLAVGVMVIAACLFVRFGWFTVAGNYLSDTARIVIGFVLTAVPPFLYWLIACVTTPNVCKVSVPLSGWTIRSGGQ